MLAFLVVWSLSLCSSQLHRAVLFQDWSQPSKLAFSYDIKYRLNINFLVSSVFLILSLLVTPFISCITFTSQLGYDYIQVIFKLLPKICVDGVVFALVWSCVSPGWLVGWLVGCTVRLLHSDGSLVQVVTDADNSSSESRESIEVSLEVCSASCYEQYPTSSMLS